MLQIVVLGKHHSVITLKHRHEINNILHQYVLSVCFELGLVKLGLNCRITENT